MRSAGRLRRLTSSGDSNAGDTREHAAIGCAIEPRQARQRNEAIAMDAHEAVAEFFFERRQRLLDQHFAFAVVDDDVFVFGEQVIDVRHRDEHETAAHARAKMAAAPAGIDRGFDLAHVVPPSRCALPIAARKRSTRIGLTR